VVIVAGYVSAIPMSELLTSAEAEVERVDEGTIGEIEGNGGEGGWRVRVGFVCGRVAQVAVDVV